MKNFAKFLGIIAMVAVIGFSMTACGGDDDNGGNNNGGGGGGNWEKLTTGGGKWVKQGTNFGLNFWYSNQFDDYKVNYTGDGQTAMTVDVTNGIKFEFVDSTGTLAFPNATTMTISGFSDDSPSAYGYEKFNGTYTKNPGEIDPWQLLTAGTGTWEGVVEYGNTVTLRFYDDAGVKKYDQGSGPYTSTYTISSESDDGNIFAANLSPFTPIKAISFSFSDIIFTDGNRQTSFVFFSATQMELFSNGSYSPLTSLPHGLYTRADNPGGGGNNPEWPAELMPTGGFNGTIWGKTSYPNPGPNITFYVASGGSGISAYMNFSGSTQGYRLTKVEGKTLTVKDNTSAENTFVLCTDWTVTGNSLTLTGGDAHFSSIMNTAMTKN